MDKSARKYPRTPHLPWSEGSTSDDKWIDSKALETMRSGMELVVTEKMDGSNLNFTRESFFGRSIDATSNLWDTPVKAMWASLRYDIPEGWRVSGENMYARKSVSYDGLDGIFLVFAIWDETNTLLSWDEMIEWASLLNLPVVPFLYRGTDFDEAIKVWAKNFNTDISEGFVIRNAGRIPYDEFALNVAKVVRANHVRTSDDWRRRDDFAVNTFAN